MNGSFWSHSTNQAHMKRQNSSTPANAVYHKSCSDSSDVEDELSHPNFPFPYKPFGNPLWIPHMYILIYVHSVLYHHYETQSLFESGHKTNWSQVNCQTQTQVLIINAVIHTAALNHRQICPPPPPPSLSLVPSKVIWSQFVIKKGQQRKHCRSLR